MHEKDRLRQLWVEGAISSPQLLALWIAAFGEPEPIWRGRM